MKSITWTQCDTDENRCDPWRLSLARVEEVQEFNVKNSERVGDAVGCEKKERKNIKLWRYKEIVSVARKQRR